nr:MAG TPA: hypothetical protein [Caudoviricetes sp.]
MFLVDIFYVPVFWFFFVIYYLLVIIKNFIP